MGFTAVYYSMLYREFRIAIIYNSVTGEHKCIPLYYDPIEMKAEKYFPVHLKDLMIFQI